MPATRDQPPAWTDFPDLNDLLAELTARVESILGENFVGAYLTGSFALGAGDLQSDCDFLVVTDDRVKTEQERALRELHDEIPTWPGHWPRHLEGSYAPKADLGTLAAVGRPWLYVDHGAREMEWSPHCNAEDVRWTLRERGITLAGPEPRSLVAEVPPDVLCGRMPALIERFVPDMLGWISFEIAWAQRYAVTTLCRMLFTLETGRVESKRAALEWAKETLDPEWRELIQQTIDDRPRGFDRDDLPRPGSVEATIAFSEYAKGRAADSARAADLR